MVENNSWVSLLEPSLRHDPVGKISTSLILSLSIQAGGLNVLMSSTIDLNLGNRKTEILGTRIDS